jgi:DNA-binding winged helix-turn-helix (wHTH) protein
MLTARGEESDKLRGLEVGADDYVTKPFSPSSWWRAAAPCCAAPLPQTETEVLQYQDLSMDLATHRVRRGQKDVHLGPTEFRLLRFLLENQGRVFSREQLLDHVWGRDIYVEPRTVDVHIRRLRKAINIDEAADLVRTVRSAGYALDVNLYERAPDYSFAFRSECPSSRSGAITSRRRRFQVGDLGMATFVPCATRWSAVHPHLEHAAGTGDERDFADLVREVVSSSCAVQPARSSQRHWVQNSISTRGDLGDTAASDDGAAGIEPHDPQQQQQAGDGEEGSQAPEGGPIVWSASQPLPDDSQVRPCAMKEVSKAYCVAVKATLHRPER